MNCPNCNYENTNSTNRCIRCGTKLGNTRENENDETVLVKPIMKEKTSNNYSNQLQVFSGVVMNYGCEEEPYGKIYKWFRAIFKGIPYKKSNQKHHMQLMTETVNEKPTCLDVLFWGRIKYGYINNGNYIQVVGKAYHNGSVIATSILNDTTTLRSDKGTNVILERGFSANAVRIISILILIALLFIISKVSALNASIGGLGIKNIIICLLLIYVLITWLKRKIRKKFMGW